MPPQVKNKPVVSPNGTTSYVSGTQDAAAISSDAFQKQTQINPVQPDYVPVANVAGLGTNLDVLPQEQQQSDTIKQTTDLMNLITGEATDQAANEKAQGLPDLQKTQTDLQTRLKTLQNEALAIPLQLQQDATGRGITKGGLAPIETAALRNNAIQALSVSSLLEASRGNITTAQSLADRATAQKYDPIKAQINANLKNLELLSKDPTLTIAQTNRLNAQKAQQDANQRIIEKQEANAKEMSSTLNLAIKYGLKDTALMERIQNAKTPLEAQQLASQYLQDPKAKYELDAARLDNIFKQVQINKLARETALLGTKTTAEIKAQQDALKSAKSSLPAMQDQLIITEALKTNAGLNSRVGTGPLSRNLGGQLATVGASGATGALAGSVFGPIGTVVGGAVGLGLGIVAGSPDDISGAGQNFAGTIHNLVGGLTIKELQDAKANGATFGALSEGELNLLAASATRINDWEIKDNNGKGTGYWNIDEASFKAELDFIKQKTQEAIIRSGGSLISPEEQDVLNQIGDTSATITPGLSYYN